MSFSLAILRWSAARHADAVEFIRMRRADVLRVMQAHAPDLSLDILSGALDEAAANYLRNGIASE